MAKERYFPLFVDLSHKKILVVGAGNIAGRRIRVLSAFTDSIYVVAPKVSKEVRKLSDKVKLINKSYETKDLQDVNLVLACTDSNVLNERIAREAHEKHIMVNVCSDKTLCDFYFPGIAASDELVVGVCANGNNHKLAKNMTELIRKEVCSDGDETKTKKTSGK